MLADFYDLHRVGAAGFAERLADREDHVIAGVHGAALKELVFRHVECAFRVAGTFEFDRVDAAEERDAPARLNHR